MGGNSFGRNFKVTTWGESHGKALGVVIDGCPPRMELSAEDIQKELDRRKPGIRKGSSPRKEKDRVEILSGVYEGETTGTPISLLVWNEDVDSRPYEELQDVFRPGHSAERAQWRRLFVASEHLPQRKTARYGVGIGIVL